jgi:hypothetical protein
MATMTPEKALELAEVALDVVMALGDILEAKATGPDSRDVIRAEARYEQAEATLLEAMRSHTLAGVTLAGMTILDPRNDSMRRVGVRVPMVRIVQASDVLDLTRVLAQIRSEVSSG